MGELTLHPALTAWLTDLLLLAYLPRPYREQHDPAQHRPELGPIRQSYAISLAESVRRSRARR